MKKNWWKYLIAAIVIVIYLLPIYVLISVSLKPMTDYGSRLQFPSQPYWQNYVKALLNSGMLRAVGNSLVITIGTVVTLIVVSSIAAYPLARIKSRLSSAVRVFVLGVMMIPGLALMVGIYSTLVSIHAMNTYWGIIAVTATFGLPMAIYMYSNFIASIPAVLDEAAELDGAGPVTTFFRIILPQLKPVTVSIALLQGVGAWNEYGYSLYILQKPDMYNVALSVKQYFSSSSSDLNGAAAAAVIAILPIIVIYLLLQRYFIQGAMEGAIKG